MDKNIENIRVDTTNLENTIKNKDDKLYRDSIKIIYDNTRSLEKKQKKKKKVVFYKKKDLKKKKIRVRVIDKVKSLKIVSLDALKNLKNNIKNKVTNFFKGIGSAISKKVKNVNVKLQEKKHLLKRKKRRLNARVRIIKRVSKKRMQLLKKQIDVKKSSVGFTNIRQKATIAKLTVQNAALKGLVAGKKKFDKAKITIIDKKNLAKKSIKRKYENAKTFIRHITIDQVEKLKNNIVALKNGIVSKVRHKIEDKKKVAGRVKLKVTGKVKKFKSASIYKLKSIKNKINDELALGDSYQGKYYVDAKEERRKAMREFFKKHLEATKETLQKNQERIDKLQSEIEASRLQLFGQQQEEISSHKTM